MLRRWAPLAVLIFIAGFSLFLDHESFAEVDGLKSGNTVIAIEVRGNHRIETATIRSRLKTKEGSPLSPERVREDIQSLYQLGFFLDLRVDTEPVEGGVKVIYEVTERPYVNEVGFVGNVEIMTDKLKERITIKPKSFLDDLQVKENAERLRQYYDEEGYYNTIVIPVLNLQGDKVALSYYIKEGAKATVRRIRFDGNQAYQPKVLKKSIDTREYVPWTSWLTNTGYYKKELLNEDVDRLKDHYLNNGYLQVQVGTPQVRFKEDRSQTLVPFPILHGEIDYPYEFHTVRASIAFPLIEGDQFRIRTIRINGQTVFETDRLREALKLKEGDLFRRNVLREGVAAIHDLYGEKGYLYAAAIPQYSTDLATKTVDLSLDITEDNPMQIRRITITGNDKTRDKVVRREMRLNEQERVDTRLLRRSFQRINNLNFFDSVEISPDRVGPDQVDLQVRVKEKSTGAFSVGGGYSSVDRVVGMAEITQGNLFGRGELLRGRAEYGGQRKTYSLTFSEPYLLDYPVRGTVDLFNQVRDFDSYKERRIGGDVILGKSFTEYISGSLSYTRETLTLFDVEDETTAPRLVIEQIDEQGNKTTTSSLSATIARDTRDFYFDPKEGSRTALTYEFAGTFLGGDNNFTKTILDASRFFPLFWDTVFSLHGRLGYARGIAGTDLPVGERFYVGGINTVRGFNFGKAGPIDPATGEITGGNKELVFNAEYLLPLVPEAKIKGVLFFDVGKAFDDHESIRLNQLRRGAGFGIRWISPIGPLRLEWGYNLRRKENEQASDLEFSIGTLF
ncbi:MAG: outer membrane protein assembly factor BamA [Nitrospirae bacterium]|nr:outer membrane protein assembly factor BamA [Nitrospirota bacterium]